MPDILPITDTEIDDVIKVAPIEVALDPNKTQGRNHRGLIKKIRDYFAQEVSKKLDKTGGKITGLLEVNTDNTPVPSIYLFSLPLLKSNRTITAIGHNVRPHPTIAGSFLVKTNGVSNGGYITAYCNNYIPYSALIPSSGDGTTDQVLTTTQLEALLEEEGINKADKDLTIFTYTASHTLVLANRGGMVRMNVASANTLTVPPNSSVAFPVGTQIVWSQPGAGQTTFVAGSGVTVRNLGARLKSMGQYAAGSLIKVSTDEWLLAGEVVV